MSEEPRFTRDENGVITDSITGKKWFVASTAELTWDEAAAAVAALTVDNGSWRLPLHKELQVIFESGKGNRNIDPLFTVTGTRFWAEEIDTETAKIFVCCNRSHDWRYKTYKVNINVLAVKDVLQ